MIRFSSPLMPPALASPGVWGHRALRLRPAARVLTFYCTGLAETLGAKLNLFFSRNLYLLLPGISKCDQLGVPLESPDLGVAVRIADPLPPGAPAPTTLVPENGPLVADTAFHSRKSLVFFLLNSHSSSGVIHLDSSLIRTSRRAACRLHRQTPTRVENSDVWTVGGFCLPPPPGPVSSEQGSGSRHDGFVSVLKLHRRLPSAGM